MKRSLLISLILALAGLGLVATTTTSAAQSKMCTAKECRFKGRITAIDTKADTLTMEHWMTTETFVLGKNCEFDGFTPKVIGLADLKVGETIRVNYAKQGDKLVADKIAELPHYGHKSNSTMTSSTKS
jgi:hypothetical protein